MAEAYLRHFGGDLFEAESAGIEPGVMNPVVVKAMALEHIDLSQKSTQDVFKLFKQGRRYSHVITVCDEVAAERCPIFPGVTVRQHWGFPDPAQFSGSDEEKLALTIQVRDRIKERVRAWVEEVRPAITKLVSG